MNEENKLILDAVEWALNSAQAVQDAGGTVRILDELPDDLIITMVRNRLQLFYRGKF